VADPAYRYSIRLADQPADAAGRRWFLKELVDASDGGPDLRAELLARALFASGGIVLRPTLGLAAEVATLTGPILGMTEDGLAPLLVDQAGAGVELDLATLGAALGDGEHAVVLRASPVLAPRAFTTPPVSVRDPQGGVVETIEPQAIVYQTLVGYGVLALIDGTTPASTEAVVAIATKAAGSWTALVEAGQAPRLRARVEDLADVSTLGRQDGYLLAWDEGTEQHVYVDPATIGVGSGS